LGGFEEILWNWRQTIIGIKALVWKRGTGVTGGREKAAVRGVDRKTNLKRKEKKLSVDAEDSADNI